MIRREDGAVAVEFLIIAPILIVVLFAIIQFGLLYASIENYVNAAREGARYAAVRCQPDSTTGCSNTLIANRVAAASTDTLSSSPTEDKQCNDQTVGQLVTVSWTQTIPYSIPFLGSFTYSHLIKASFRCE